MRSVATKMGSRGLECLVGGQRLSIPLESVEQVIEYPRSALPLARPGVAGLGIFEGELLLSLSLPAVPLRADGMARGVLLRGLPLALPCALEVDATFNFLEVLGDVASEQSAGWTRSVADARGESLLELDVGALVGSLSARV
jgi:hypothetical protein